MIATIKKIQPDHPACPAVLRQALSQTMFASIWSIGNLAILETPLLGFFCSQKCPGDLIIKTFDSIRQLREANVSVIGGFHSPMEKECLELLLRGKQPVVVCPARSIEGLRVPGEWKPALGDGRLLVLSPFQGCQNRRMTTDLAQQRNWFTAALSHSLLVPHAAPDSKIEQLCLKVLASGKKVYTFESVQNQRLLAAGAADSSQHR